jgi:hypothetical protein
MCCIVDVEDLVVLWWTPFTGQKGAVRHCGAVKCFFTEDRRFDNHNLTKVSMKWILITNFLLSRSSLSVTCPGTTKNMYISCLNHKFGKKNETLQKYLFLVSCSRRKYGNFKFVMHDSFRIFLDRAISQI